MEFCGSIFLWFVKENSLGASDVISMCIYMLSFDCCAILRTFECRGVLLWTVANEFEVTVNGI